MITGGMKHVLQAEGAALFLAATLAYGALGTASWWMFIVLFLVPDISFAAYAFGPRVGAYAYNALHSTVGPLLLGIVGWWSEPFILRDLLWALALIWIGHVGFDRMLGYGLKYASGFKDTHLGRL
jgi:Domain of unknown function (DUF4260)